ncbi:MAG: hypothetical protein F4Z95_02780 [Gammaproteobacteria bacterium]|nr:hypothetical protein [Gammaproteobacteria bacterium]
MNKRIITALMAMAVVASGCNTMESAMVGAAAGAGVGVAVAGSNDFDGGFDEAFGRATRGESVDYTGEVLVGAVIGALIGAFVGYQRGDAAPTELVLRRSIHDSEAAGPSSNQLDVPRMNARTTIQPLDPATAPR